jgi:hypothetical protein
MADGRCYASPAREVNAPEARPDQEERQIGTLGPEMDVSKPAPVSPWHRALEPCG